MDDLAYIAGFFDGEGSIILYRRKGGWAKRLDYSLLVHISNTRRDVLDWIASIVGGHVYAQKASYDKRKVIYRWQATADPAGFLRLIRPYVRLKEPQIEVALAFQKTKEVIGQPRRFRTGIPDDVAQERARLHERLHALNHRGPDSI